MITKTIEKAVLAHAAAEHPKEACGFIVIEGKKKVYKPLANVAAEPETTFAIAPEAWIGAGEVLAVVHSHPEGQPWLSAADRLGQQAAGLPWVLCVSGSLKVFRPVPLLRGRVFDYGKADCYSLLADAYHLAGIELPPVGRTTLDEDAAARKFETLAGGAGFRQVHEAQPGDVLLTALGGHANHVALYLGDGNMLHHAIDQLSRREMYGSFWRKATHSIWRHKDWRPEMMQAVLNDLEDTA